MFHHFKANDGESTTLWLARTLADSLGLAAPAREVHAHGRLDNRPAKGTLSAGCNIGINSLVNSSGTRGRLDSARRHPSSRSMIGTFVIVSLHPECINRVRLRKSGPGEGLGVNMATKRQVVDAASRQGLHEPSLYINRDLSWLTFNQRVLDQALDESHPLLERVKFLAIVGSNLDEFFMVRVATHLKKVRSGLDSVSVDGMSVSQQLSAISARAAQMVADQASCWDDRLRPALADQGVRFLEPDDYTPVTRRFLEGYFRNEIYPLLTPLAFDPGHPFPLISNRSKNLAVVVRPQRRTKFARVKIPPTLPRFVPIPYPDAPGTSGHAFAFIEDVIRLNLGALFSGVDVVASHLFRVVRDTDMEVPDDGADDLMESVDRTLKQLRHGALSLLQVEASMPRRVLNILVDNFEIEDSVVMRTASRLDFSDWMALCRLPLPHLKDRPFAPRSLWAIAHHDSSVFDDIREQDRLVHHPFDSFAAVETFVHQAATDPHVAGLKITLYRIGRNSPLLDMLIAAADAGKQVAVLVELKARFDERNNIQWATRLEEAGVHVVYGVENLKTHCKLCLVVRKEADGVRRYAHIGTGNYNRATSQVYTDFGLFTANPHILDDVSEVFNFLTGYSRRREYHELLVAPVSLRARLNALIEREIAHAHEGRPARVIVKNNALTDPGIIRSFYRASREGVDIDLIVRGACALRPAIPGVSDRIRVRSVVGRFLEHSRIYYFENGGEPTLYVGSADLMERNLDRRVETLCRVADPGLAHHIRTIVLDAYLRDTHRAYALIDDRYERVLPGAGESPFSAQDALLEYYSSPLEDADEP
jgi:polyphosphate kinase